MAAIVFYIECLERKIKDFESSTNGESARLDSSNAEAERDAANEYATDAKKENESLRASLATEREKNAALAATIKKMDEACQDMSDWLAEEAARPDGSVHKRIPLSWDKIHLLSDNAKEVLREHDAGIWEEAANIAYRMRDGQSISYELNRKAEAARRRKP